MDKPKLRKLIQHHADSNGLARPTLSAFAAELGISISTISRYLKGTRDNLGSVTEKLLDERYRNTFERTRKKSK